MNNQKRPFIDFAAVKAAVSLVQILEHYGIAVDYSKTEMRMPCPIHGGTNPKGFSVNTERSIWKCFSACQRGGNIFDYVSMVEGVDIHGAALIIDDWFELNLTRKPKGKMRPMSSRSNASSARRSANREGEMQEAQRLQDTRKETSWDRKGESSPPTSTSDSQASNNPLGFALKNLDAQHPYILQRGITDEAVAEFGIGYCSKGSLAGHVVVPIHNARAELLAYMGRWPGEPSEDKPKYRFPKGFHKGLELFNIHRALACPTDEPLILVEGVFDVIHLWECGIRRCVALMGSTLTDAQAHLIAESLSSSDHVEILFDEDDAGRTGRAAAAAKLVEHCYVRIIRFPEEGLQPDDLDADQLIALFE